MHISRYPSPFRQIAQFPTLLWCVVVLDLIFHEMTSRAHNKCPFLWINFPTTPQMSICICIWQIMKSTEGLSCLKMADSHVASVAFRGLWPMQPGGRRMIKERDKQPKGAEKGKKGIEWLGGCQTAMRALTVAKRMLSALKCAPNADHCFVFDFHHSYFWLFNVIFGHFISIFATWHGKR